MAFLSIIRRWHKREHVPIREISRRTGVSRNTIRKYLRSDVVEPRFQLPDRPSKLDPYAEKLSAWLRREAGRPRKQRRTVKQLYGDLVSLGYDGSYNRVAAFARAWKEECQRLQQTAGRGTFVPLAFAPGEAFQFDWSEDFAVICGVRMKLQVAHSKLCHSRAFVVRAYLLQTHEMLFDAHNHAFRALGGVPRRGMPDYVPRNIIRLMCPTRLCGAPPQMRGVPTGAGHILIRARQAIRGASARSAKLVVGEVPPKKSKEPGMPRGLLVSSGC